MGVRVGGWYILMVSEGPLPPCGARELLPAIPIIRTHALSALARLGGHPPNHKACWCKTHTHTRRQGIEDDEGGEHGAAVVGVECAHQGQAKHAERQDEELGAGAHQGAEEGAGGREAEDVAVHKLPARLLGVVGVLAGCRLFGVQGGRRLGRDRLRLVARGKPRSARQQEPCTDAPQDPRVTAPTPEPPAHCSAMGTPSYTRSAHLVVARVLDKVVLQDAHEDGGQEAGEEQHGDAGVDDGEPVDLQAGAQPGRGRDLKGGARRRRSEP